MVLTVFIVQYVNTETALFGSSDSIQCFVIKGRWVSRFLRWPITMGASMPWCLCTKAEFRLGKTADMCGLWPVSPLKWSFFSLAPALTLRYCSKVLLPTLLQRPLSSLHPYKFKVLEFQSEVLSYFISPWKMNIPYFKSAHML